MVFRFVVCLFVGLGWLVPGLAVAECRREVRELGVSGVKLVGDFDSADAFSLCGDVRIRFGGKTSKPYHMRAGLLGEHPVWFVANDNEKLMAIMPEGVVGPFHTRTLHTGWPIGGKQVFVAGDAYQVKVWWGTEAFGPYDIVKLYDPFTDVGLAEYPFYAFVQGTKVYIHYDRDYGPYTLAHAFQPRILGGKVLVVEDTLAGQRVVWGGEPGPEFDHVNRVGSTEGVVWYYAQRGRELYSVIWPDLEIRVYDESFEDLEKRWLREAIKEHWKYNAPTEVH